MGSGNWDVRPGPEDEIYRRIEAGQHKDADNQRLIFRTTEEMLEGFHI